MALSDPITKISGLGEQSARKLAKFGVEKQLHFLFHLPIKYQDKTKITPIDGLVVGQPFLVEAMIDQVEKNYHGRKQLICKVSDHSQQQLSLRFFHWSEFQAQQLQRNRSIQCYGEVGLKKRGLEMIHPEYCLLNTNQDVLFSPQLRPVYPNTLGIAPYQLKKWVKIALEALKSEGLDDVLSPCLRGLPSLTAAILTLHAPNVEDLELIEKNQHPAQKRLILDEFCANHLALIRSKHQQQAKKIPSFAAEAELVAKLQQCLSFKLTVAQSRVIAQIQADLAKPRPMMRLLQGDVGCGKTIVAVFASLTVISHQYQVAIMAPTEILAKQHLENFSQYLQPLGFKCVVLVASQSKKEKKQQRLLCEHNQANVIIGTHALFQESVQFANLGLVIIDEQHKFGVHQRLLLSKKSSTSPHQLIMTATPIPRSLTMSLYADLDTSIIDELPPSRKPVQTIVVSTKRKDKVWQKINQVQQKGQQVYWVCTLIDDSEILPMQSALASLEELKVQLPQLNIALIHGRLDKAQKTQIMSDFNNKKIDILIATTIIEVGVDVPNAGLMIVENAERLGLAQLHQLRGRVGRGDHHSLCILLYQAPLSENAKQRLDILRKSNDGFAIAQKDLELRGPGELLGAAQTGVGSFKIADLTRDEPLLKLTQKLGTCLLAQSTKQQNVLINRWYPQLMIDYGNT